MEERNVAASRATSSRVLLLINDLSVGGAERVVVHYANHIAALDAALVLLYPTFDLRVDLRPGVPVHVIDGGAPSHSPAIVDGEPLRVERIARLGILTELWRRSRQLTALLGADGETIVSAFLTRSQFIALFTKLVLRARMKLVLNVHEMMSDTLHHYYPRRLDRALVRAWIRFAFPRADRVVAVSDAVKRDLVERFGIPAPKIIVLENPLDRSAVRRLATEAPPAELAADGAQRVVAVGRLTRIKGFDVLVNAFARLPESVNARLFIVGEGEERAGLETLILRTGVAARVHLLGAQQNPWRIMARADVFVLSSHTEAFPNVIGEAMTLGVPVIATECSGGVRAYLADGECGVLVPPDDVDALSAALVRLLGDAPRRAELRERGMARVRDFDVIRAVRNYEEVLLEVADTG
jgi:glycosyltransferase involved in cell wall biosynthesis